MERIADNVSHYQRVVEAWTHIMGEDFHVGFFESPEEEDLGGATHRLIHRLADWIGDLAPGARVLDVGCGTGSAARQLHEFRDVRVVGITITEQERSMAESISAGMGLADSLEFLVRDARNNGFPADSFDLIWQLESSHLMPEKQLVFAENFRVLKPGGRMILCDFILRRPAQVADLFHYADDLAAIEKGFGRVKNETLDFYRENLQSSGFVDVITEDVTEAVRPTIRFWQRNLVEKREDVQAYWSLQEIEDFGRACDAVDALFDAGLLGYGFVRADRLPEATNRTTPQ